jgi:hypothetical protein
MFVKGHTFQIENRSVIWHAAFRKLIVEGLAEMAMELDPKTDAIHGVGMRSSAMLGIWGYVEGN